MKKDYASLIIGGSILISGLTIAWISNLPVAVKQVPKSISLINGTTIEPHLSKAATIDKVGAGNTLLVTMSADPPNVPFEVEIKDPAGNVLSLATSVESPYATAVVAKNAGNYELTIYNNGTQPAIANAGIIISEAVISGLVILELTLALVIPGVGFLILGVIRLVRQHQRATKNKTSN